MPPLPPWEGMHPLVVHAPLGLLFITPVLLLLSLLLVRSRRGLEVAIFIVVAAGSFGAFMALQTGEAAEEYAEKLAETDPEVHETLEAHENLGKISTYIFLGLTVFYGVCFMIPGVREKLKAAKPYAITTGLFFLLYIGGLFVLTLAGHKGAELSHVHNVNSPFRAPEPGESQITPVDADDEEAHDDHDHD